MKPTLPLITISVVVIAAIEVMADTRTLAIDLESSYLLLIFWILAINTYVKKQQLPGVFGFIETFLGRKWTFFYIFVALFFASFLSVVRFYKIYS